MMSNISPSFAGDMPSLDISANRERVPSGSTPGARDRTNCGDDDSWKWMGTFRSTDHGTKVVEVVGDKC